MRENFLPLLFIVVMGVVMRLIPHAPNMTPVTALALFGGMYFDKKYALILPLAIMVISDLFLGFHDTVFFVYVSFLISGALGFWVRKQKNIFRIYSATVAASVIFFMISNTGVWLTGTLYERTLQGFIQCFTMALPFFRNTVLGDFFYVSVFIILFEYSHYLLKRRQPVIVAGKN